MSGSTKNFLYFISFIFNTFSLFLVKLLILDLTLCSLYIVVGHIYKLKNEDVINPYLINLKILCKQI